MPFFHYRARNRTGVLVTGNVEAANKAAAEINLDKTGLIPLSVKPAKKSIEFPDINLLFQTIAPQDTILFSRQLATLFTAGIPLTRALFTLETQLSNKKLTNIIKTVREDVEGGATFAQALKKHPHIFDETYYSMVEAGEAGGILDSILDRLAAMKERIQEINSKVKSATLYPKIVVAAILIAVIILMTFVVPKFARLYSNFNVPLPLPTRILIAMSNFFSSYWYLTAIAAILPIVIFKWYTKTDAGHYNWDKWKLNIPIFGPFSQKATMSRFARVFGSLYKSGLPILQSLDIVSRVTDNRLISRAVKDIEIDIRSGKSLSELMEQSHLFPPMVVQMVRVGEETGALDEMLEKVAQYYDQEVDYTVRNLTTSLEPILLTVIFGMVLFLALAIFLPMWDIVSIVKR
ncbi:MAG TPA: type II secretion system F family protein [Thermodesulfobacteriota bacterium]|nr:type II secretion system F family protein [Thermodesulfobacteriota bacterium]